MDRPILYLLWSNKHSAWWAPRAMGYTPDVDKAGRYSEHAAIRYVAASALCGRLDSVTCMVAAPDNWEPRDEWIPTALAVHSGT